ncbi:MAG TPA: hypothetical protein VJ508_17055, partial [Saprospiraceae bacterium]|nr:hypothetical protein [Saprospiraceae bacterium]
MPNRRTTLFALFVISSFTYLRSQTLHPGDFGVVSVATDLGSCGFPAGSDEISFICFQNLQNGTTFEMTDNGYEQSFAGLWGNQEGTLSITRTGAAIPKGTIMTLRCINMGGGNFSYQFVSPDNNFAVGNINLPGGGPFDLDPNGDQIFWMFGGNWSYGAGVDQGTYDGVICYGFNTLSTWSANGTIHQSNLPPDLSGCFYVTASPGALSSDYFEYDGHPNGNSHFTLLQGLQDQSVWKTYTTCTNWENNAPDYTTGTITIIDDPIGIHCGLVCNACPNTDYNISWTLPPGIYNVWITNGTDTIEFMNIHDSQSTPVNILDTVTWTVVAVEEVGGCKIFGPFQFPDVTINSEYHDPGLHNDLWLCPTFTGPIELFYQLNGTPDMGGTWKPNIAFNTYYYTQFGQGMFTYTFVHMPIGSCPNDTASVTVHFLDPSSALVDVSCDQNGTPNDIYDDVTVITLHWPPDPYLPELAFSITSGGGTVMPTTG